MPVSAKVRTTVLCITSLKAWTLYKGQEYRCSAECYHVEENEELNSEEAFIIRGKEGEIKCRCGVADVRGGLMTGEGMTGEWGNGWRGVGG